jgi:hypothetical protein
MLKQYTHPECCMTESVAQNLKPEMFSTLMLTVNAAAAVTAPASGIRRGGSYIICVLSTRLTRLYVQLKEEAVAHGTGYAPHGWCMASLHAHGVHGIDSHAGPCRPMQGPVQGPMQCPDRPMRKQMLHLSVMYAMEFHVVLDA